MRSALQIRPTTRGRDSREAAFRYHLDCHCALNGYLSHEYSERPIVIEYPFSDERPILLRLDEQAFGNIGAVFAHNLHSDVEIGTTIRLV